MSSIQVRRFARIDREQVTALVNAHVGAVVPNVSVSVQGLMSQLEREPGEFIVDPWVAERITLIAIERERVVAAAHLLRYGDDDRVALDYRGAGEIRWLVFWPDAPQAGQELAVACLSQLERWGVRRCYADGSLPAPGVYGVPEQWPHIRAVYEGVGFCHDDPAELVFVARIQDVPRPNRPIAGLTNRRTLGINGTRISAVLGTDVLGYIEVDTNLDSGFRTARFGTWADIGNLHIEEKHRRQGIGRWLLGQAAEWLDLGGVSRLLSYADSTEDAYQAFLASSGFRVLTRTLRGMAKK